jgi:hypothetical protein
VFLLSLLLAVLVSAVLTVWLIRPPRLAGVAAPAALPAPVRGSR